jgi:hypothetical protein
MWLYSMAAAAPLHSTLPLTAIADIRHSEENASADFSQRRPNVRARFLGKDADSQGDNSPTLFATDRIDRRTYIAQGWIVTDAQALADVGPIPAGEAIIEIPEDVLKLYLHNQTGEQH